MTGTTRARAAFVADVMQRVTLVMTVAGTVVAFGLSFAGAPVTAWGPVVAGVLAGLGSHVLARQGRGRQAVSILAAGIPVAAALFLVTAQEAYLKNVGVQILFVIALLVAFLGDEKTNTAFGIGSTAILALAPIARRALGNGAENEAITALMDISHFSLLWFGASYMSRSLRRTEEELTHRLGEISGVVDHARKVAKGDLSPIEGDGDDDDLQGVMVEMVDGLRDIVVEVQGVAESLRKAASELSAMASQHEKGATSQASAVTETRETIESFVKSAERIAATSSGVLGNAESTLTTSREARESMNALRRHVDDINGLLESIKEVANKSEVLALNASLEGVKAGDAGRGFSLVAGEMQRLAENTMQTVQGARGLTDDIGHSTKMTVAAISEATKLAEETTQAAREISLTTQQQGSSARQIVEAMQDVAAVTNEFATVSAQSAKAIDELEGLAKRLQEVAHRFQL